MEDSKINHSKNPGLRIKYIRYDLLKLSREIFSKRYNLSAGTLQGWEKNRYQKLSNNVIETLLQAFRKEGVVCSKEWLISGTGEPPLKRLKIKLLDRKFLFTSKISKKEKDLIREQTKLNKNEYRLNKELFEACKAGSINLIQELIDEGANAHLMEHSELHLYNNEENSPLHIATLNNHLEIIKILLKNNTHIDVRNRKRESSLHWACHSANFDVIEFLIKNGAEINSVEHEGGTPFAWACYMGRETSILELLHKNGADINLTENENNTPLYWACYKGHSHVVKFLMDKKADFKKLNSRGNSILDIAIKNGCIDIVDLLLSYIDLIKFPQ